MLMHDEGGGSLSAGKLSNECPTHGRFDIAACAPDITFQDLAWIDPQNVRRGKVLGTGAFGAVYAGFVQSRVGERRDGDEKLQARRLQNEQLEDVALKVLQTWGPSQLRLSAPEPADRLETVAHAYCVARKELNLLAGLQHANITTLIGFSRPPLTLIMELAPLGSLDTMLSRYRRAEMQLAASSLQQTCAQVARALEYLHSQSIIYR